MPCWYCGVRLSKKYGPTMKTNDHVVPKSKGGQKTVSACLSCNSKKADYSLDEFRIICGVKEFWAERIARIENEKTSILEDESRPSEPLYFLWKNYDAGFLNGRRFGRFTVVAHVSGIGTANSRWICRCDCGNKELRRGRAILNENNDIDACVECRQPLGKYRSDYWHNTGIELDHREVFKVFYPGYL